MTSNSASPSPPRWFYPLVAACLVVLTVAGVWRMQTAGRYVALPEAGVLDTHTGRQCYPNLKNPTESVCFNAGAGRPSAAPASADPFADLR